MSKYDESRLSELQRRRKDLKDWLKAIDEHGRPVGRFYFHLEKELAETELEIDEGKNMSLEERNRLANYIWKDSLKESKWPLIGLTVSALSLFSAIGFNIYNINRARDAFEAEARPKIEQVIQKASGRDGVLDVDEANTLVEKLGYNGPPVQENAEKIPVFELTLCNRHNNYRILTRTWRSRTIVARTLITGRYGRDVSPRVIDDYLKE